MDRVLWTRLATVVVFGAIVAACQGSGSQPTTETVRATIVTAPADLQLLCASEAATRFSANPNEVLPTSSAQISSAQYQVELTLSPGAATCVVDENGNIISLVQA
ncbi:MAG: hypothetical protein AAGJ94_09595 [Pseudomonadota bacterium]